MKLEFSVKRKRMSVTQGFAAVYCNDVLIETFGDTITLDGQYGENIGGWSSTCPDNDFIYAVLFPSDIHRNVYPDMVAKWEQHIKEAISKENQ